MLARLKDQIDPPVKEVRVCFLHLPKCAGTSVTNALMDLYKPWRPSARNRVVRLNDLAARSAEDLLSYSQRELRNPLLAYSLAQDQARLVIGHFTFSQAVFDQHRANWHFATVLRDPVSRWLSHYFYNKDTPGNKYNIDVSMHEFLKTSRGQSLGALMVNWFSEGLHENGASVDAAVQRALYNLNRFSVVGQSDNMTGFSVDLQKIFGRTVSIPELNVGNKNRKKDLVDQITLDRICEVCEPDIKLYQSIFQTKM